LITISLVDARIKNPNKMKYYVRDNRWVVLELNEPGESVQNQDLDLDLDLDFRDNVELSL
jgi:hypothetical protein